MWRVNFLLPEVQSWVSWRQSVSGVKESVRGCPEASIGRVLQMLLEVTAEASGSVFQMEVLW